MNSHLLNAVKAALDASHDPLSGQMLSEMVKIDALQILDGIVKFVLEVPSGHGDKARHLQQLATQAVQSVDGVVEVQVVVTEHLVTTSVDQISQTHIPSDKNIAGLPTGAISMKSKPDQPIKLDGVRRIIAIASGKGGVGKSTVSANLAAAAAMGGWRTGLLDADVYGPSQPRMMGIQGRPASPDGQTILPLRNHGVTLMSIGLMAAEDEGLAWRGPMLISALRQMLLQVAWGRLDVLFVDLPPGTGDVQLSLCQNVRLDGAVIVSTPQDIALIDTRKGVDMFQQMDVPILGIIENMSSFVCDGCEKVHYPFGHGGARTMSDEINVPFLGDVPLDLAVPPSGDHGKPIVISRPDSPASTAFFNVINQLVALNVIGGA